MKKKSSLSYRLVIPYLLSGLLVVIVISLVFYSAFKEALIHRTYDQLSSINTLTKFEVENYLQNRSNIQAVSKNPVFEQIISSFHASVKHDTSIENTKLQHQLKQLMNEQDCIGLIVLDKKDSLIFSFGKNISSIHTVFNDHSKHPVFQKFIDQSYVKPTLIDLTSLLPGREITLLLGTPVLDENDEIEGVVILEKDNRWINHILQENATVGSTGETYIVAEDLTMRSYSRFISLKLPSFIEVKTKATASVFSGRNGQDELLDYRGEKVLSVFCKLEIDGVEWAIISEIDEEEAMKPIYQVRNRIIWIGLIISLFIFAVTIIIAKKISEPILQLHTVLLSLSKGVLPSKALPVETEDEIGQITEALNELVEALKKTSYFANEIGKGNLDNHYHPLSEQDELGNALLQMQINLKKLNEEKSLYMKQRSIALIEGQEKERTRISRELHDGIGQMITAIRLQLNFLETKPHQKDDLKKMLDETNMEIKRISQNLMPSLLIDFGLKSALNELIEKTSEYAHAPIQYTYREEEGVKEFNFEIAVSIYRVVQEAINNALKYAKSDLIEVAVRVTEKYIYLDIMDNGLGFDISAANEKKFNGIKNMQERVHLLGGEFNISSGINKGTRIHAVIPYF